MAADCKSARASVRWFESSPFHHFSLGAAASVVTALCLSACASAPAAPAGPHIQTQDVALFFSVYDQAGGRPDAQALQALYLDRASSSFRAFAARRELTGERIAAAIAERPGIYQEARACAAALPRVQDRLEAAFARLSAIYPAASLPPVTIFVGRGRPVGEGSPEHGVLIGLEALCAVAFLNPDLEDRFVYVIAHEYAHVQQPPELASGEGLTVLEASLAEGGAEFIGSLIAGEVAYSHLAEATAGRALEIETAFAADMDKTDQSDWLYNYGSAEIADLGYWVGYRIARAYYLRAADKRRAVRDILQISDAKAFLAASGWRPGIDLSGAAEADLPAPGDGL